MKLQLLLFLSTLILFSCNKKEEQVPSPPNKIEFSGLSKRDETGSTIGEQDETDWTNDSYFWRPEEKGLFRADTLNLDGTEQGTIDISPATPNPFLHSYFQSFTTSTKVALQYVVVNEKFEPLIWESMILSVGATTLYFYPNQSIGFEKGKIYRVYYAFYAKEPLPFHKGHGDIMIN